MNNAIFFDRDGVLNIDPGFLHKLEDLVFYPTVVDTLAQLAKTDYKIIIVTNQAGIARGYYSEEEYKAFEKDFLDELARLSNNQIRIDKVYYCPHHAKEGIGEYKKNCICRKPEIGMLKQAQKDFDIDFSKSFIVGDRLSDIQAGITAGLTTVLATTGCGGKGAIGLDCSPDWKINNLEEVLKII